MKKSYEIKIFQIDRSQYEIRDLDIPKTISEIINQHKKRLGIINSNILNYHQDGAKYWSYVYNEDVKKSYWRDFLPLELSAGHDFDVKQISFVLFCNIRSNIFAVVGGSGIRVIKKFLNDRFGIDVFERFMNLTEDLVISHISRGILGSLSENRKVYRNQKYLNEAFDVTDVPTKILVKIRDEIKDSIFDFIKFSSQTSVLEVGSYFHLKIRLDFDLLNQLLTTLNEVLGSKKVSNLTSFVKIEDYKLISSNLEINLFGLIYDDYGNKFGPNPFNLYFNDKDIDFIHPSNLIGFYECDKYEIEVSHLKNPVKTIYDRGSLYYECLSIVNNKLGTPSTLVEFIKFLRRIRIKGYRNNELVTQAKFFDHITSEIEYNSKPYFKVDNLWYEVKDEFIHNINLLCHDYYSKYEFVNLGILRRWPKELTEGAYNSLYRNDPNFYVFDKILSDNIEMCDLLFIDDQLRIIYLIHVKDGFDAKMRDLYNQIILSSERLLSDIKNSNNASYLQGQVERFNKAKENIDQGINIDYNSLYNKMAIARYKLTFVMAFNSGKNVNDQFKIRLPSLKSNIAKYALVQTVKEIDGFDLNLIDLADI
ncbi:DUF6119 family protein [Sphingobacterium sp.]|uniref:DUF6119 family protein n=1 Tax=Sphingobacterium sp. TaxID=341027 RepID=UPI0031D3AAB4